MNLSEADQDNLHSDVFGSLLCLYNIVLAVEP